MDHCDLMADHHVLVWLAGAYDDSCQQQVYQWSGFATQLGAFAGTAVIFPLVFFHESIFEQ